MPRVSCLCVTHAPRAKWLEWLDYQFNKQSFKDRELIIVAGDESIGEKRTEALRRASGEYIAWFDDDDWQSASRLELCVAYLAAQTLHGRPHAAGNWRSFKLDAKTASQGDGVRCREFQSGEGLIFNGAVYRRGYVPRRFAAINSTEDTIWQADFQLRLPDFVVIGQPLHMWLCHTHNVTNSVQHVDFDRITRNPLTEAERATLRRML